METYAVEMKNIDISFGDFQANKNVSLWRYWGKMERVNPR